MVEYGRGVAPDLFALTGRRALVTGGGRGLGVNVNAIAPGYFRTELTAPLWRDSPERNAEILARLPAGRWGETPDLAGAIVFLASAASDYVHGIVLPVDGGWLAR
jgi:2-deoxy-D-gluconate 3-dehydrogenase